MRESSKSALGGIIAALSVSIMLLTYLSPFFVYTAPQFAGLTLLVIVVELGYKWAFGAYTAISLLSIFLIADKEAAVFYIMLFGYYPILRELLENKIGSKILRIAAKVLLFNAALVASVAICNYVFMIDFGDLMEHGWAILALYIVLMNIALFVYDYLIRICSEVYMRRIHKKMKGLFK